MRKAIFIILPAVLTLMLSGCKKFLDRDPLSQPSEATFWKTPADAQTALNAVYSTLPDSRDFWRDCHSDNSVMTNAWGEGGMGYICQGSQSATDAYIAEEYSYDKIRVALYFIDRLKTMTFDAANSSLKVQYDAEARYILAMRYLRMVKLFGDIPLIKEAPVNLDSAAIHRSPAQEVLDYVLQNINIAINNLPARTSGTDDGHITKAAALMLKADYYLYVASMKKFHKGQDDPALWKNAADAVQAVIDEGVYSLESDYSYIFTRDANNNNKEVILAYQYVQNEITNMVPVLASPSGTGITGEGWASFCPTRDLVDSYLCTDGNTIQQSSLYDKNKPWENRDKRLKMTFMLPGVAVLRPDGTYTPYDPYPGHNKPERMNSEGGGLTGYMYLKFNDPTWKDPVNDYINFPIYRYAETLLMLAEALNEYDPSNAKIVTAVNAVRTRAGLPSVNSLLGNQSAMRNAIREERRHEFVCEHKRYFDILRWKIAENVLNTPAYGINSNDADPVGDWTKPKFKAQDRKFDPNRDYLWPIPQSAIGKNKNLVQNPGY